MCQELELELDDSYAPFRGPVPSDNEGEANNEGEADDDEANNEGGVGDEDDADAADFNEPVPKSKV